MKGDPKIFLVTQGDRQRLVQAVKPLDVIKYLAADVTVEEVGAVRAAELAQTIKLEKAAA